MTDMNAPPTRCFIKGADVAWETPDKGITRQILGYDDHLMLVRVRFEQGAVGVLHDHPHRQVSYVESGSFEVEIAGDKQILKKGDCFFIPPDVRHGALALEEGCLIDVFAPARETFIEGA